MVMSTQLPPVVPPEIEYPDSDGQPMAENTLQFRWIVTIEGNLDALYPLNANVFVAGDLLWYPVQGDPTIRVAPDILVAFGRPKGDRGSYRQWVEGGVAPQVVFEILSPGNTDREMADKFAFYERYGVEEYYVYDPDGGDVQGWRRVAGQLQAIAVMHGWVSPRLGIRFDLSGAELVLFRPDGQRFLTFVEVMELKDQERRAKEQAEQRADQERRAKEQAEQRADQERQRADQERRAKEQAEQRVDQERQRAESLAAQLRALGIEPNPPPANEDGAA
jgi:Uma2 family endonuclease